MSDNNVGALAKKLAEVMGEIKPVAKEGVNTFHNYSYARESEIVEEVRQKLAKRNVIMLPSVTWQEKTQETITDTKSGEVRYGKNACTKVALEVLFIDGDTGATITRTWYGEGQDSGDKGLYKAYTGAIKYALLKSFLIPTNDDPEEDGEQETKQTKPQAKAQPKKITQEQRERLAALATEKGVGADGMAKLIKERFKVDSSKQLTEEQADGLIKELEAMSR